MSIATVDYRKQFWKGARKNKHNAQGVHDPEFGFFHSKREHQRFYVLRLREKAGEIRNLKRQAPYQLIVNGALIATIKMDFVYEERAAPNLWTLIDEDSKGFQQRDSKITQKLFEAIFGRKIRLS